MQLSKGAGLKEIIGMSYIDNVDGTYNIVRPFIDTTRDDINNYLLENNLKYFTDDSNFDIKYKRNYFRHNFVNEIVSKFSSGIRNSFKYLEKDYELIQKSDIIFQEKDFYIVSRTNDIMNIRKIDEIMKTKFKYLLSKEQREDIASDYNVVFNNISISANSDFIFIAPYITEYIMDKKFKEKMRLLKIPANVRQYIFKNNIDINAYCIHL
jgi:tRNA(Ile)-lysidine synthase